MDGWMDGVGWVPRREAKDTGKEKRGDGNRVVAVRVCLIYQSERQSKGDTWSATRSAAAAAANQVLALTPAPKRQTAIQESFGLEWKRNETKRNDTKRNEMK